MLSKLRIQNFKSIGSPLEIHPRSLTLLLGPNGSGKSSILEALCVLSQSVGQMELQHSGELVRYDSLLSLIHRRDMNRYVSFELGVRPELEELVNSRFLKSFDMRSDPVASYRWRMQPFEAAQSVYLEGNEVARVRFSGETGSRMESPVSAGTRVDARHLFAPQCFDLGNPNDRISVAAQELMQIVSANIRQTLFLSAVRGDSTTYLDAQTGRDPQWVGPRGEYTPHVMAKFFALRENEERQKLIVKWAERLGLNLLKAGWPGGNRIDSDYMDPILKTFVRAPLASYGARQALAIITQLFASPPGSILLIEEPEISLHPESQMLLPELFAEAVQRGVQLLITTHSIFLPLSLWRPISQKLLAHDDIAVYHTVKTEEGTQAEEIPLTEEGFLQSWIPSFSQAEEKAIRDFLKVVPKK